MHKEFLRSPRGVLALIGATLAGALVFAMFIGTQRAWFERHIREKLDPPATSTVEVGKRLDSFPAARAKVTAMAPLESVSLYEAWLQSPTNWPAVLPAALVWGAPDALLERARRTLAAGSPEQRQAAVDFLGDSGHPNALPWIERAGVRSKARGESSLAQSIIPVRKRWEHFNRVASASTEPPGQTNQP